MTRKLVEAGLSTLIYLFLLFPSCFQQSFAASSVLIKEDSGYKDGWFLGGAGSWVWPNLNQSSTTVVNGSSASPPSNLDSYSIHNPNSTGDVSLYGGYRFDKFNSVFPSYSLAFRFQHLVSTQLNGMIQQYSLPAFTNYNYSLNVSSDIFSVEGKVDVYQFGRFSPYVSVGIGLASTSVSGYNEQAVAGIIPRISPAYGDHTANNFMFDAGLGFDYQMTQQFWASLGYEYSNLGKIRTNSGTSTWANQSLSFGTLTNQAILLGLFYQLP
jgi:opacity protein-like surface antigen